MSLPLRRVYPTGQGGNIHISLVDDERLQTAGSELIGRDEQLREIVLPETGTYMFWVEGNIDETSGAYVIIISGEQP